MQKKHLMSSLQFVFRFQQILAWRSKKIVECHRWQWMENTEVSGIIHCISWQLHCLGNPAHRQRPTMRCAHALHQRKRPVCEDECVRVGVQVCFMPACWHVSICAVSQQIIFSWARKQLCDECISRRLQKYTLQVCRYIWVRTGWWLCKYPRNISRTYAMLCSDKIIYVSQIMSVKVKHRFSLSTATQPTKMRHVFWANVDKDSNH